MGYKILIIAIQFKNTKKMAKTKGVRVIITLECTTCRTNTDKRSNGVSRYTTMKNRRNTPERLEKEVKNFDFVDIETLNVYLDDQKRILPRRVTELSIRNQRRLTKAVKRARLLGLLPFTVQAEY